MKNLIAVLALLKKTLLVLLIVLWPVTARASLIFYDISWTVAAANVGLPLIYGDISVRVHFVQDTEGDPFQQNSNSFPDPYDGYPYTYGGPGWSG